MATGREYQNFDIVIEQSGEKYRASVTNSPCGQASVEFNNPFSALELENFVLRMGRPRSGARRLDSPEMQAAKDLGRHLFTTVFSGEVNSCFLRSIDQVRNQNKGLRMRLHIKVPDFNNLPWEFLYNPQFGQFVALSHNTPIIRYFDLPYTTQAPSMQIPLRILVMISSPEGYQQLDVEKEWGKLNKVLKPLIDQELVVLEKLERPTLNALLKKLRQDRVDIFHYIGHGKYFKDKQDGMLLLEDEFQRGRPTSGQHLGAILNDHYHLRLVVLNACEGARTSAKDPYAGVAQTLVRQGIPAVLAMQFEIFEDAAMIFAEEFYSAIVDNYPVDAALSEARKAIFASNNDVEWGTPVLFMRTQDGTLFRPESPAEKAAQEEARREVAEKAEREAAEKAVKEKAAREKAEQERKERERLEREAKVRKEKGEEAGRLYDKGVRAQAREDYDEAEKFFRQSLQIAVELNDEQGRSNILSQLEKLNQNRLNKERMEHEAAQEKAEQERKQRERLEREASVRKEKAEEAGRLYDKGVRAQAREDYDEAEKFFRQSLQIAVELNDEQGRFSIQNQLEKLNQDRLNKEQIERETAEKARKEKEAAEKAAREKAKREAAEKAEQERKKRERLERDEKTQKEKEAAERMAREKAKRESQRWSDRLIVGDLELLRIPKGKFTMGDANEEHEVNIPYDYFLARFPVTNQLFKKFVDASNFNESWGVNNWNEKLDHPVVNVSWRTTQTYCQWLNQQWGTDLPSDLIFRLPTEAEWEKAARSTDSRMWPWGNEFDHNKCNAAKNIGVGLIKIIGSHTTPIGKYAPQGDSPYGLADMAGNVWEWTHSLYLSYPYRIDDGRESDDANKSSRNLGSWKNFDDAYIPTSIQRTFRARISRGGSYIENASDVQVFVRHWFDRDYCNNNLGFRVALAPPLPK